MPITTATKQEEKDMAQIVTMKIECRGGGVHKHLHLESGTVFAVSQAGGPVTLNVEILPKNSVTVIPLDLRPNHVRLWFPRPESIFVDSTGVSLREIFIFPITYTTPDHKGRGSILLDLNPAFPLVDGKKTVIPLAIYTDVDEGQDPGTAVQPGNRKGLFGQPGVQMVDGANSHPECEVGP